MTPAEITAHAARITADMLAAGEAADRRDELYEYEPVYCPHGRRFDDDRDCETCQEDESELDESGLYYADGDTGW
jgi:hypothetical protein